jgi:UDP-N-acetylmuramoyl-L-alanyl-D-glutamate--2,6-diaminopimelate ligase
VKKTAIINLESDYKELFLNETYDNLTTYGFDYDATIRPTNIKNEIDYTSFDVKFPGSNGDLIIKTKMRGKHNIYNILAAMGVFLSLGMKPEEIQKSILDVEGVPGRLEDIKNYE